MDLTKLKSAVTVDDPALVRDRLERASKRAKGELPHTTCDLKADGQLVLRKQTASVVVAAPAAKQIVVPSTRELEALARQRELPWQPELAERVIPWWASDERVDGHGEIVLQNWHFEEFADNPVIPFSHEWWAPPVGNALDWKVLNRVHGDYVGPALSLLTVFATKETWEWADTIFRLLKARFLRGGSVGFWSAKVIDVTDPEERAQLGLGPWGFLLDENHLLEFSPTTIGANPGTFTVLSASKSRGELQPKDMLMVRELARMQAKETDVGKDEWAETCARILSMSRALFPKFDFKPESRDLDLPLIDAPPEDRRVKGAVAVEKQVADDVAGNVAAEPTMGELIAALDEGFAALFQMIGDVRDMVEQISGPPEDDSDDDSGDGAPPAKPAKPGDDREMGLDGSSLDRLSALLDQISSTLASAGSSEEA